MFSLAAKKAGGCSTLDRPNGHLKQVLRNICLKSKKPDTFLYQHFRRASHS